MPRYFFLLADGTLDPDDTGTHLPNDDAARVEAIRFASASLEHDPRLLQDRGRFRVIVTHDDKRPLFAIRAEIVTPAGEAWPTDGDDKNT